MSEAFSIDAIQERHEILYDKVIESYVSYSNDAEHKTLLSPDERRELFNNVEKLIEDFIDTSPHVTLEDYLWLRDAAGKWEVVYSSLLDHPRPIRIPPPRPGSLPTQTLGEYLSESELAYWLERHQKYFEGYRQERFGRGSTGADRAEDWHLARTFLASDILDGKTNFALRIAPGSYWHLESEWMEDLKRLRSYLLWLDRKGGIDPISQAQDHNQVGDHLRFMLIHPGIKAEPEQFGPVKTYLETFYFRSGKIDPQKKKTHEMIATKAHRLYEQTGQTHAEVNWSNAETYAKVFYENIIAAVMDDDYESAHAVLKAMQSSRDANTYHIINCFEATLITYFLNPKIVQAIWDASKDRLWESPSSIRTVGPFSSWPAEFVSPPECEKEFEFSGYAPVFKGVMSVTQKEALLAHVGKEEASAIEELFIRSRLVHKHTTL